MKLNIYSRTARDYSSQILVPFFVMRNVQTGRQYVTCWYEAEGIYKPVRLDYIMLNRDHNEGKVRDDYDDLKSKCEELYENSWGVNLFYTNRPPQNVSFTIQVDKDTGYIAKRLYREKRNGVVDDLGDWKYRFRMDLYDPIEILPWITTFYGYIVELVMEDEEAMNKLKTNFQRMVENHLDTKEDKEVPNA